MDGGNPYLDNLRNAHRGHHQNCNVPFPLTESHEHAALNTMAKLYLLRLWSKVPLRDLAYRLLMM